jgi:hypothetical protein
MHHLWQDLVVIGLIAAAMGYVALRVVRLALGKSRPGCATCQGCPRTDCGQQLISIDPPADPGPKQAK